MIRISRQADYAVLLLTFIANHPETTFSARDLAERLNLPQPTVSKILKWLSRGGLLSSHRGVNGGYTLSRPAEEVSVAEIVAAVDGPIAITDCIEDAPGECIQESSCVVRGNWQRINHAIRVALEGIRLSEMCKEWTPPPCGGLPVGSPLATHSTSPTASSNSTASASCCVHQGTGDCACTALVPNGGLAKNPVLPFRPQEDNS